MTRKIVANGLGSLGIVCSLAFWMWYFVFANLSFHQREAWMRHDLGVSNLWPALWVAGLLLPIVAAVVGSRRWFFAAILPVVSCAAAIVFVSRVHP